MISVIMREISDMRSLQCVRMFYCSWFELNLAGRRPPWGVTRPIRNEPSDARRRANGMKPYLVHMDSSASLIFIGSNGSGSKHEGRK
jgi:hypothetical protein